jgi:hypothetical protein
VSAGNPTPGTVSAVFAASGPKAKTAKIRPISSVAQAVFLPVMKLIIADTMYPFIQFPIAPWALHVFKQSHGP